MRIRELLRLVRINTLQNKFKVLLTSLGILAGTATIVLVIAIGQGAKNDAEAQYSGLSADTVSINPDYKKMQGNFDTSALEKLDEALMENIRSENPYLKDLCIRSESTLEVRAGKNKEYTTVAGVSEGYSDVFSLSFFAGSDFSEADYEEGEAVVVIGFDLAEKYFGDAALALAQRIKVGETRLHIIGVLARNEDGLQGINHDSTLYVPYKTMLQHKMNTDYSVPQITAKVNSLKNVKKAMQRIQSSLDYYMEHSASYAVEDAGSRIESATKSARTMSMLLVSVAMIVLTVGGIGIMNVLFVTIKERTREIGVLKALGSPAKDILLQFLLESVSIGIIGGILGILVSGIGLWLMQYSDMPLAPSVQGAGIAFLFAVLTSAVFGFYPAYKASQLKPVDALSYE
ncbi:MAG: ABC transporter permease [Ruthenibacterium sp.]